MVVGVEDPPVALPTPLPLLVWDGVEDVEGEWEVVDHPREGVNEPLRVKASVGFADGVVVLEGKGEELPPTPPPPPEAVTEEVPP